MANVSKPAGLTVLALKAFRPRAAAYEVKDDAITGAYVQVWPSGATSYLLRYRFRGASKKLVIGKFNPDAGGLSAARSKARAAQNQLAEARRDHGALLDPVSARRAEKARRAEQARKSCTAAAPSDTIEKVVAEFVSRHAKPNTRDWKETQRLLEKNVCAALRGRRLSDLGKNDVHTLLDLMIDRGAGVSANRTLAAFRKMCRWALSRGIIERSPVEGIGRPTAEKKRERVLDDDELRLVALGAATLDFPFGPLVQLLLYTGQRRSEVAGMSWGEIDLEKSLWTIPAQRSKNHREHSVPLSHPVKALLAALPRFKRGKGEIDWVFSPGHTAPSGLSRAKVRLDAATLQLLRSKDASAAPLPPWVFHDIRRSVVSGMARLGTPLHVIERCVNHISGSFGGIVGVYQRHSFSEEMRVAEELWGRHIETIVSGEPAPANVAEPAATQELASEPQRVAATQ